MPGWRLVYNFVKAVIRDLFNKRKRVTAYIYIDRLNICALCVYRAGDRCTHINCGCYLSKKAWWASEKCPIEKWKQAQIQP